MALKLFKFRQGHNETLYPFKNAEEAYEKRAEVDPTYHFAHVDIEELVIPGFEVEAYETKLDIPFADIGYVIEIEDVQEETPKNKGGRPKKDT